MIKFFRRYEKYIFWGIVIVILPTFSVTGIMMSTCGHRAPKPAGELYGEPVPAEDFEITRSRLGRFQRLHGGGEITDRTIWHHLAFLAQAERAAIDVTDDELASEVQRRFRLREAQRLAYERYQKDFGEFRGNAQRLFEFLVEQEMPKTTFDFDEYARLCKAVDLPIAEHERTLREVMRIQRLMAFVASSAQPDPEKLYDQFQLDRHKRKGVYVAFRAADYPLGATASAEDLRKHYESNSERFQEPAKVNVEWVSVSASGFAAEAPSDADVAARYEATKMRYRLPDAPLPATPTPGVTPTAALERFRPLEEVKGEIVADLATERKLELAARRAEELRTGALAEATAGRPVTLSALAAAAGAGHGETGLVEPLDLIKFPAIQFWTLINTVQRLGESGAAAYSETFKHEHKGSAFFLRLVERRAPRTPPFEEVRARVEESWLRGLDEDLRKYHAENMMRYRSPETATIEWAFVPYARFEKQVPEDVTGTARRAELRKKAEERLAEVRAGLAERGADGKAKDLETAALDKGAESGRATVETGGKDLPAQARATESLARLAGGDDKPGEPSPVYETEDGLGVGFYLVKSRREAQQLTLAECKERVRADLLLDRADGRAREAAEAFAKEVAPRPAELRALAAAKGLAVAETPFLARGDKDKVEGVKDASRLVGALFGVAELGGVSRAVYDSEAKTTFVARYTAKEPAPPAEFAEASKALRPAGLERARQEAQHEFETRVLLEAQSVDEAILKESYELRYGAEGIATIEAATVFVAMDDEVLRSELAKKAKRDAEATLAEIRRGGRFDELARKRSQDGMRRRGGDTRWFTRGKLPQELAGLTAIEDAAFTLKPGETSEPIETSLGWHLLQVTERRGEEVRCRHMLFRNQRALDEDGTLAPLDPEVEKLAMEKALEKAKKAEERVKSGEDFGAVARELSDIPAYGQKHPYSFETPFTRQVFAEAPGEVSKVLDAGGGSWQLLLVEEWTPPEERDDALRRGQAKPRLVRRITASGERGKRALEQAREELADIRAGLERDAASGRTGGGRSSIQWEFTKAFEDLAREESAAPSGARGGRLGIFRPDPSASRFGAEFRETLFALKEGETSALVKTRDGYHLVRVLGRVRKSYEEARREVADGLLQGLSF